MMVGMTAPPTLIAITVPGRFSTIGTVYSMPKNSITLSDRLAPAEAPQSVC